MQSLSHHRARKRPSRERKRHLDAELVAMVHLIKSLEHPTVISLMQHPTACELARKARYSVLSMLDKLIARGFIRQTSHGRMNANRCVFVDGHCKGVV